MLERRDDGYEIDTDPGRIDLAKVHLWLSTDAYWALGRTLDTMTRAVEGSICFGVYRPGGGESSSGELVGFARVVTDMATFGWLCDVYIEPSARAGGLGTWLVRVVRDHVRAAGVYRILLATADAHGVYERLGFTPLADPGRWMENTDTRDRRNGSSPA